MSARRLVAALVFVVGLLLAPGASKALAGVHAATHVYDVSSEPYLLALHVAAGDFNGDGRVDLVTSDLGMGGGDATVLFGRGDGTFADGEVYDTEPGSGAIAVGDLDGDGRSDMVLPSGSTNSLTLLYGNADSSFDMDSIDLGVLSTAAAVGHFDAGPDLDIAAATSGSVMLLLGENAFDQGIEYSTGGGGYGLIGAGDFNGDGRDDVVAYPGPGNTTVAVLLSNADGTLQAPRATPLGYMQTRLAIGRVNADARSDVVLAPSASLALAGPDGTLGAFAPMVAGGVLSATLSAALGDFNADNMTDVALSAPYTAFGEVKLLAGRGDGTFATPVSIPSPDATAAELLTDLNGDGFGDLVITDARNERLIVAINAPAVATSHSGLGYGSVMVGNVSAAKTLTITNDGLPPLAISGLAFGGANPGDFRVVSDACTGRALAAGARCDVVLVSAPLAGGVRTANLAIFSNAPTAHIALNGGGVVPAATPAPIDRSAPRVRVSIARQHLSRVLKRGLVVTVGSSEPCTFEIDLLRGHTRLAHSSARLTTAGARTVVVKLGPRARRTLRRTPTAKLTLRVRGRDAAGNTRTATRSLTLKH